MPMTLVLPETIPEMELSDADKLALLSADALDEAAGLIMAQLAMDI